MAFAIPRNTAVAAERTIPFVLVDATDEKTPEDINVSGVKAQLSFGGAADAPSTNDIIKVDGALGMYAIVLTQAEANNNPGPIHGHCQPAGCARTYLEAQIGPSNLNSATVDANVTAMADGVITAAKIADGALTAAKFATGAFNAVWTVTTRSLTTFGTLVADVATAVWSAATRTLTSFGALSTDVTAIKAKTDPLTFTVAGVVDANIQNINDRPVTGNGQPSTKFGVS